MPDNSGLIGSVIGSVPSTNDAFNAVSGLMSNLQAQQFSKKMYARQYDDSIKFWNMQNAYNSPEQQMFRFKAAGLNPNLIYGQGSSGNAGSIPTPDVTPVNFREPRFEGGRADVMANLLGQADLRIKGAQADNLTAQNEVIRQDAVYRRLQAEREGFDLQLEKDLREFSADARRYGVQKLKTDIDISMDRNAREAALNTSSIQEAAERMLTMRAQRTVIPYQKGQMSAQTREADERVRQMLKDGTLKDMDIKLKAKGINPNDPMWARIVGQFLDDLINGNRTPSGLFDLFFR